MYLFFCSFSYFFHSYTTNLYDYFASILQRRLFYTPLELMMEKEREKRERIGKNLQFLNENIEKNLKSILCYLLLFFLCRPSHRLILFFCCVQSS